MKNLREILDNTTVRVVTALFTAQATLYGCGLNQTQEIRMPTPFQEKPKPTLEYFYNPDCERCAETDAIVAAVESRYGDRITVMKNCVPVEGSEACKYDPEDQSSTTYLFNLLRMKKDFLSSDVPTMMMVMPGGSVYRVAKKEGICEALDEPTECLDD